MRRFFADTFYWIALLVRRDDWHERVTAFNHTLQRDDTLFTTDAIILEFLAAFSSAGSYLRQQAVARVEAMLSNPYIHVVEVPRARLLEGLALYKDRPDEGIQPHRLHLYAGDAPGRSDGSSDRLPQT